MLHWQGRTSATHPWHPVCLDPPTPSLPPPEPVPAWLGEVCASSSPTHHTDSQLCHTLASMFLHEWSPTDTRPEVKAFGVNRNSNYLGLTFSGTRASPRLKCVRVASRVVTDFFPRVPVQPRPPSCCKALTGENTLTISRLALFVTWSTFCGCVSFI